MLSVDGDGSPVLGTCTVLYSLVTCFVCTNSNRWCDKAEHATHNPRPRGNISLALWSRLYEQHFQRPMILSSIGNFMVFRSCLCPQLRQYRALQRKLETGSVVLRLHLSSAQVATKGRPWSMGHGLRVTVLCAVNV